MYGIVDLKPHIDIAPNGVECPVLGCNARVEKQKRSFKRVEKFRCPKHKIYISPSTFEYDNETDNLLWKNETDLALLNATKTVKRESRMARDNSEDAVTWNVFRYLETSDQVAKWLSFITQKEQHQAELIYWSYSQKAQGAWPQLNRARKEFGENLQRSSEPDSIAVTETGLFFIEAKVTAANKTTPSSNAPRDTYLSGGGGWSGQAFKSDYETITVKSKFYELFRFWLLGSWLASQMGRDFYLINVVLSDREKDIEQRFTPHLQDGINRKFIRVAWEDICSYINDSSPENEDKRVILDYFRHKTLGYSYGKLKRAFAIE